jgi:DNA-directed RNA polymerase specialized sigma24 family protein
MSTTTTTTKEVKLKPEHIRVLLQYANMHEHRECRPIWKSLFDTTDKPLQRILRSKFSNIAMEDIEELVSSAFMVFQMQLIKKAALREEQPTELESKLQFIHFIERRGFMNYLFNLCNWMAHDFLRTRRRRAMNITQIDNILGLVNDSELYQEFEGADFQPTLPAWWKKIETLLGPTLYPAFRDYTIKGLKHKEIAEEYGIQETNSIDRNRRALDILRRSNLMRQFRAHINSKSIFILFIIILYKL